MEEFIGYGLVGLMVLGLFFGIRKITKKKKTLFEYDDEIVLDNNIVHYGPFSGSVMYPHRKFIFSLLSSSFFQNWTRTIDGWGIDSYSDVNLILQKQEKILQQFLLEMANLFV